MGGFNLLEVACRRLVPAGRQLLLGEEDKMHLKLMSIQPPASWWFPHMDW